LLDELSTKFDVVIVDTPAMAVSADALLIGQQASGGRHARAGQDGIVLLGRVGHTTADELGHTAAIICAADAQLLGTALITLPETSWARPRHRNSAISSTRS